MGVVKRCSVIGVTSVGGGGGGGRGQGSVFESLVYDGLPVTVPTDRLIVSSAVGRWEAGR